jgi:hypothetical protein
MAPLHPARIGLALALSACTLAFAKLPAPSDEAKAKAAETAAKAAWSDKVASYQLCKSQDAVAATYYADKKKAGKEVKPPVATAACADPGPFVYVAGAAASAPAPAAATASASAVVAAKP